MVSEKILNELKGIDCSEMCKDHIWFKDKLAAHDRLFQKHDERIRNVEDCRVDYQQFKENYMKRLEQNMKMYGLLITAAQLVLGVLIFMRG